MSFTTLCGAGVSEQEPTTSECDASHMAMSLNSPWAMIGTTEDVFMESWCTHQASPRSENSGFTLFRRKNADTPVTTHTPSRTLCDRSKSADQIHSSNSRKRRDIHPHRGSSGSKYLRCSVDNVGTPPVNCERLESPAGIDPCVLPVTGTSHSDLSSISGDVVRDLLEGKYAGTIDRYYIVDCRYPYEYEAGHIRDALNLYTGQQVREAFFGESSITDKENSENTVIVVHCEFSSKRGPRMCRLLRNMDRQINSARYPHLHFPQLYILEGGYSSFFSSHKEHCDPMAYTPMVHKDYKDDLRNFKVKSKSWPQPTDRVSTCKVALRF